MRPHRKILALARAGNPARAWALFKEQGLESAEQDIGALTLKGRLLKDLARRAEGDERLDLFAQASEAYLAAYALETDSYPLINAATLALLSDNPGHAAELAQDVLDLIDADPEEGETAYWREATMAEALLILGRTKEAEARLAAGIAKLPQAWEDHAATIGQFERIIAHRGDDPSWLDAYRPACAVHFSGLIGLDPDDPDLKFTINELIRDLRPGFAFGALAAGADILLAEALVEAGAVLHVMLPFERDEFRAISVTPFGADWEARFDALMERAEQVDELTSATDDVEAWLPSLVECASLVSMGQCVGQANILRCMACAVTLTAPGEKTRPHISQWEQSGRPLHLIETPRVESIRTSCTKPGETAPQQGLSAVLVAEGASTAALKRAANAHQLEYDPSTAGQVLTGPPALCLAAGLKLVTSDPDAHYGMVVSPIGTRAARAEAFEQAAYLSHLERKEQLFVDQPTAMIAKVMGIGGHVEQMGEVSTPSGPVTLYSISPA